MVYDINTPSDKACRMATSAISIQHIGFNHDLAEMTKDCLDVHFWGFSARDLAVELGKAVWEVWRSVSLGLFGALASRLLRGGKAGERPDSLDEQFSGTSGMVSLQRPLWIGTTLCCGVTEESHVLAVNLCHVTVGQLV